MRRPHPVSLYYKLFLVFGLTFVSILFIMAWGLKNDSDLNAKLLQAAAPELARQIGWPVNLEKLKTVEKTYNVSVSVPSDPTAGENPVRVEFAGIGYDFYQRSANDLDAAAGALVILKLSFCFLIILLSSFGVRAILRPIDRLNSAAREFSDGNFEIRLRSNAKDEIGDLARAFDFMADKIQSQLEALKHMTVGVSHEIRTPLTRLRLLIENVKDEGLLRDLAGHVQEINTITESILEREALNSGLSNLSLAPTSLFDMLQGLREHYLQSGHELEVQGTGIIEADPRRVEMCLKNVLDNAFRYGRPPVRAKISGDQQWVAVSIEDHGDGIKGKTGLGLQLCASVMKAHGGEFELGPNREDGRGTKVILRFRPGSLK